VSATHADAIKWMEEDFGVHLKRLSP